MKLNRLTDEELLELKTKWEKNIRINQSLTFYLFIHTGWPYKDAKKWIETGVRPD